MKNKLKTETTDTIDNALQIFSFKNLQKFATTTSKCKYKILSWEILGWEKEYTLNEWAATTPDQLEKDFDRLIEKLSNDINTKYTNPIYDEYNVPVTPLSRSYVVNDNTGNVLTTTLIFDLSLSVLRIGVWVKIHEQ